MLYLQNRIFPCQHHGLLFLLAYGMLQEAYLLENGQMLKTCSYNSIKARQLCRQSTYFLSSPLLPTVDHKWVVKEMWTQNLGRFQEINYINKALIIGPEIWQNVQKTSDEP